MEDNDRATMIQMTQAEYARHRGVSPARVNQWIGEGKLKGATKKSGNRVIIFQQAADKVLEESIAKGHTNYKPPKKKKKGKKPEPTMEEKIQIIQQADVKPEAKTLNDFRLLDMAYKSSLRKLEFEEKNGDLVRKEDVYAANDKVAIAIKNVLAGIPNRISAMVAAETDPRRVRDMLKAEVRNALEAMSKGRAGNCPNCGYDLCVEVTSEEN